MCSRRIKKPVDHQVPGSVEVVVISPCLHVTESKSAMKMALYQLYLGFEPSVFLGLQLCTAYLRPVWQSIPIYFVWAICVGVFL